MSQDNRYQFHMGCGEPLCSQWWRAALTMPAQRRAMTRQGKPAAAGGKKPRGGRKA